MGWIEDIISILILLLIPEDLIEKLGLYRSMNAILKERGE